MNGYTVNGSREMISVGVEALEALEAHLDRIGDDAEVAEIRIYENLPIAAVIHWDNEFRTFTWTREAWVEVPA